MSPLLNLQYAGRMDELLEMWRFSLRRCLGIFQAKKETTQYYSVTLLRQGNSGMDRHGGGAELIRPIGVQRQI